MRSVSETIPATGRSPRAGSPHGPGRSRGDPRTSAAALPGLPGLARGVRVAARGLGAGGPRRRRLPGCDQARGGPRRRRRWQHPRQRHGGRAGQRQGQAPADAVSAPGARRSAAPGRSHRRAHASPCACPRVASTLRPPSRGRWPSGPPPAAPRSPRCSCGRPTASWRARSRRSCAGSTPASRAPSFRPDKGTALRIGRRGVLVHNAETLAHVAMIARTGPDAFRAHGLVEDPGTSLVTISGTVEHPGVVEVDRGTPLIDLANRAHPGRPAPGAPRRRLRRLLGRPRPLRHAVRIVVTASHRSDGRGRHRDRAGPGGLRTPGVGAHRPLHGRPERRPVRAVRVRAAGHRRRPDSPGPWTRRRRPHGPAGAETGRGRRTRRVPAPGRRRHTSCRSALHVFGATSARTPSGGRARTGIARSRLRLPEPAWAA